jgi:hypothetical protein
LHRHPDADCITGQIDFKPLKLLRFAVCSGIERALEANFAVVMFIIGPLHFSATGSAILLYLQPMCLVSLYLATANALRRHFGCVIAFRPV